MALLSMVTTIMYAQTIVATGQVVDQTGETIIGATVMEKGTNNGTITDIDGNFKLSCNGDANLVVSYIGYETQELKAGKYDVTVDVVKMTISITETSSTGISSAESASGVSTALYDLGGNRLSSRTLRPGCYIQKKGSYTRKVMVK